MYRRSPFVPGLILALLAGCSSGNLPGLYKLDVRQGNYIDQMMVDQLRPGMTRQDVQLVLGSPLIDDPFHSDRWDYYYVYRPRGGSAAEERHLSLHFENGLLQRVDSQLIAR